jgi:hypothetical protein
MELGAMVQMDREPSRMDEGGVRLANFSYFFFFWAE